MLERVGFEGLYSSSSEISYAVLVELEPHDGADLSPKGVERRACLVRNVATRAIHGVHAGHCDSIDRAMKQARETCL